MNPLLLPVVAAQGAWVRMRTKGLPPADGPTAGTVGDAPGAPLRIAVLGESTAAGCGVGSHDDGFTGALARELAERSGRRVEWQVIGQDGATARRIRYRLLPRLGEDLDLAVLLAGVNDVLTRRPPAEWAADLEAILDGLGARASQVLMTGVPPFDAFPSLPGTLGCYLAGHAAALDEVSRSVCAARPGVTWVGSADLLPLRADFFAADRFHPSAAGYRRWAHAAAPHVAL